MNRYRRPTDAEWRRAIERITKMEARERGLAALAAIRELLARGDDDPPQPTEHASEDDTERHVPRGTTSHFRELM